MGVLVGKKAPDFRAKATQGGVISDLTLSSFRGRYVVLFFYPLDFTFVCPTELHAFQERLEDFEQRETQLIGCSVDSPHCHLAWLNTPKSEGGIQGITYPIVSDLNKTIAAAYDVLMPGEGISYRGLFLIDREGNVKHQVVNDLPLGRSVDETLRTLDALIYSEKHGEVCPADWRTGEKSLQANQEGLRKYFAFAPR